MSCIIPERLKVFIRPSIKITRTINGQQEFLVVKKAFATNMDSPKTHITAEKWASQRGYGWNDATQKYVEIDNGDKIEIIDKDNKPFRGLKVYDIDVRSEGGRAYKVQTEEGWAFDMREQVLLDTIMGGGVRKGGYLEGEFIWVRDGSQMKITRVGSKLYKEAQKHQKRVKRGKIKLKDLEIGGIYENVRGDTAIYLGRHTDKRQKWVETWHCCSKGQDFTRTFINDLRKETREFQKELKKWEKKPEKEKFVTNRWWGSSGGYSTRPLDPRERQLDLKKTHSFTDKIGQLTLDEVKELVHITDKD